MGCTASKPVTTQNESRVREWDGHIRPVRPWKVEPAISTEHLDRLRNEFWETRIEGRPEMWQALRFAAEAESEELCDQTIEAAGLHPASKRCTLQAMFDELGALYEVPMYCIKDPTNLDIHPVHEEFKDAAHAVADYVSAHTSRRIARMTGAIAC